MDDSDLLLMSVGRRGSCGGLEQETLPVHGLQGFSNISQHVKVGIRDVKLVVSSFKMKFSVEGKGGLVLVPACDLKNSV